MAKDLFSNQSKDYARYRPSYPPELYDYLLSFVPTPEKAWDCATGNGQAAVDLAGRFKEVQATDLSAAQIQQAIDKENITYHVCPAEQTPFPDNSFDLITVAQAYHWLNWNAFEGEATRVGKPGAVVAIWGYNLFRSDNRRLDELLRHFYKNVVGPYWDQERKYVDEDYQTVAFPFQPLPSRTFETSLQWSKQDFKGYLSSWSAVQHYIRATGNSPLSLIEKELDSIWTTGVEEVRFPLFLRLGQVLK